MPTATIPRERRPIVGVMGSSTERFEDLAVPLGEWLAAFGVHLLNGGGEGVMAAVSRAFYDVSPRAGQVIGILPGPVHSTTRRGAPGYPNSWVEIPIYTHLPVAAADGTNPLSRNHINILTSDVVIVLPGGHGTQSEVDLAVQYARPVIVWFGSHDVGWKPPENVRVARAFEDVQRFVRICVGQVPG